MTWRAICKKYLGRAARALTVVISLWEITGNIKSGIYSLLRLKVFSTRVAHGPLDSYRVTQINEIYSNVLSTIRNPHVLDCCQDIYIYIIIIDTKGNAQFTGFHKNEAIDFTVAIMINDSDA